MDVSCAFPSTLESAEHVVVAEQLGYDRAWLYDTPQQSPDVWVVLAQAAQRTSRIGLGPGVLVPSLRHPVVNAAATATLEAMAPGRLAVSFGTGFTGRKAMGDKAITWSYMESYLRAFRGLLRGETVEWDGTAKRMLHPEGSAPPRPVEVPVLVGALGPKGHRVASALGDGLFVTRRPPEFAREHSWVPLLAWGTVLEEGEDPTGERVRAAAGPGWALAYHHAWESGGPDAVRELPGGSAWLRVVESQPAGQQHLAVHSGHCVELNEADRAAWDAGGHSMLRRATTLTGTRDEVRESLRDLASRGATEIVFQPCGPDPGRELAVFAEVARSV